MVRGAARRTTYLGTEHLLLGLAGPPQERAAQALARCGADPATIRGAVDGRIGAPKGEPLPDETPFTQLALRSLQHALREALLMNQAAVGGEHLALGLLTVGAGVAHDVLDNLGVSYERLREAVAADGTPHSRYARLASSRSMRSAVSRGSRIVVTSPGVMSVWCSIV
jgi:ATP-dependent Clp protease ATP-binding subunit ClpA